MDIREAIVQRHSVRQYQKKDIDPTLVRILEQEIRKCNQESGLNIQLILNDPECFHTLTAHYGKFRNADHYLAMVADRSFPDAEEKCGYYGERLVLLAQQLGLNSCWVAGSYGKGKCRADRSAGEKLVCVISIGYGENSGTAHRSKSAGRICDVPETDQPEWFKEGVQAALLAPTAVNQQRFMISLSEGEPVIRAKVGPFSRIDLGIVKYHFEAVSGHPCR